MTQNQAKNAGQSNEWFEDGLAAGAELANALSGRPTWSATLGVPAGGKPRDAEGVPLGADAAGYVAQNRFLADGKKLSAEEQAKRKALTGIDATWDMVLNHAREGKFPKGTDVFMIKYQGMFYVAPTQNAFMCRLRIPGGILTSAQLRGIAQIAQDHAGGYADCTTRANLQLREIGPRSTVDVLMGLHDLGIVNRGAGADNIRNITGSATAGIDPDEIIDTRVYARRMHHYILAHRDLYGLPRKFNIAFDGCGRVHTLEETNDIGFAAVRIAEGHGVKAGVYFRLALGGITGHKDFARDAGVMCHPDECVELAAAVVRVFLNHGDRTDRQKARLKYVLDRLGPEQFLEETEKHLPPGMTLTRFPLEKCEPRPIVNRHGHIGFHPQKQPGLYYVGIVLSVGRMTVDQMRGLSDIADQFGSGTIRLTVWQNLLISDIRAENVDAVKERLSMLGIGYSATSLRSGLIACTGAAGCKYAAAHTKQDALAIDSYIADRLPIDVPINLHLTGCHHSCAQHYIGDLGMLGAKVIIGDDMVEGYHIYVGGGYGSEADIARELYRDVPSSALPAVVERILLGYLNHRESSEQSFRQFILRHPIEALKEMFAAAGDAVPAQVS